MTRRITLLKFNTRWCRAPLLAVALLLFGCAAPALREAEQLALEGQHEQALTVLDAARHQDPADSALRAAQRRKRELTIATLANQADAARASWQWNSARDLLARLEALDANHLRTQNLRFELARAVRHQQLLLEATRDFDAGRTAEATTKLRGVLAEAPGLPAARATRPRWSA